MAASTLTSFDDTTKLDDWSIRVRLMEFLSGVFLTDIGRYALIHELSNYFGLLRYSNSCADPIDFTEKICCFMRSFHQKGVVKTTVDEFFKTGLCSSGANLYLAGEVLKLIATSDKFEHPELLPGLLHTVFHTVTGAQTPNTTPPAPAVVNKKHDLLLAQRNNPYYFVFPFRQTHSSQEDEPEFIRTKPRTPKQDQSYQPSADNDIKITRDVDQYHPDQGVWTRNNFIHPVEPFVRQDKTLRPRTIFHIDIPASLGMDANEVQAAIEELLGSLKKLGLNQQPESLSERLFNDLHEVAKVEALIQDFSATNPHVVFTNDELWMIRHHLLQWIQSYPKPLTLGEVVDLSNEATQRIWEILKNSKLAGMAPGKPADVKAENEAIKDAAENNVAFLNADQHKLAQLYSWAQELIKNYRDKHPNVVIPIDQGKRFQHDLVMWMNHRPIPQTRDQAEDYVKIAEKKIEDLILVLKSSQFSSNDITRVKLPSPMELYKLTTSHIQQYFSNRPELNVPDHAYLPIHRSLFEWLTNQPLSYFKQSHTDQTNKAWAKIGVLVNHIPSHIRSLETSDASARAYGIVRSYLKKHPEVKLSPDDFSEIQKRLTKWLEEINEPALIVKMCQVYTSEDEKIQAILSEIQAQKNDSLKSSQGQIDTLVDSLPASPQVVSDINMQVTVRTPQEVQTQLLNELLYQARTLSSQVNDLCSTTKKAIAELRQMIPLKEAEYFQRNQKPTL